MKKLIAILLGMIFPIMVSGQIIQRDLDEIKVTPPRFIGTERVIEIVQEESTSILDYLAKNFEYQDEWDFLYEGVEVIQFTVTPKGKLTNFEVINGLHPEVDNYIIEIIKETEGYWKPGTNNGEPIAMEKEVAMEIRTGESEAHASHRDFTAKAIYNFKKGSKSLFVKNNAKKALRNYNRGMLYAPYEKSMLLMRGLCHYELGNTNAARQDWMRLKELGGLDMEPAFFAQIKHLKGYKELAFMFSEDLQQ